MKKSIIKTIALFFIILISILIGYENPELIESTKSIFKSDKKTLETDEEITEKVSEKNVVTEVKANSFSLKLLKIKKLQDQSASLFILKDKNGEEKFK